MNSATPPILPAELIEAASRVCVEIHGDGPDAVAAMLADLAHYPAEHFAILTKHFTAQLLPAFQPPDIEPRRPCRECAEYQPRSGRCLAAARDEIRNAARTYRPDPARMRNRDHFRQTDNRPIQTDPHDPFHFLRT